MLFGLSAVVRWHLSLPQQLVRKVCVNRGMVDEEVKSSVNAYVVYKDGASVEKVGCSSCWCCLCR